MNTQKVSQPELKAADISIITKAANTGNTEAQHQLGMAYANGNGVDLDYKEAFKWIQKAADSDHLSSLRTLGWLYANGFGVEQNDEEAQNTSIRLAEIGEAKDQYFLASLYQSGLYGMKPDSEKMISWYYKSAQQHYARAQYALAKIIIKGVDIKPNDEMAFQWLSLANINGHKKADEELKKLIQRLPAETIENFKQRMTESIKSSIQQ
ncbi:MAG: sel1 repeat family protein [Gammaproteobacteria bacterium]|nr:sel1 repeat family protein [Gammaproteobacteria bacterium]